MLSSFQVMVMKASVDPKFRELLLDMGAPDGMQPDRPPETPPQGVSPGPTPDPPQDNAP